MHKITKTSMLAAINSKKFLCLNHYVGLWYGQTSWILYEIFAHGKKKTGICITFAFISAGHRHVKDVIGWYCFHYRYYALEVSYFKSSLDRKLLESLWNKYWVNTLSSSSLLTVSPVQGNPTVYLLCPYNLGGGGGSRFFFFCHVCDLPPGMLLEGDIDLTWLFLDAVLFLNHVNGQIQS